VKSGAAFGSPFPKEENMKSKIAIVVLLNLFGILFSTHAQTISPLVSQYAKKARGAQVHLVNNGLLPTNVTIEAKSLEFKNGVPVRFLPLDPSVHLKLSATSARLVPKQDYTFWYDASCDKAPCSFAIFATFYAPHADKGIAVAVHMMSTVYICDKIKNCRELAIAQSTLTAKN
jgi:hypothetical protein